MPSETMSCAAADAADSAGASHATTCMSWEALKSVEVAAPLLAARMELLLHTQKQKEVATRCALLSMQVRLQAACTIASRAVSGLSGFCGSDDRPDEYSAGPDGTYHGRCVHAFRSGKNKGTVCGKHAFDDDYWVSAGRCFNHSLKEKALAAFEAERAVVDAKRQERRATKRAAEAAAAQEQKTATTERVKKMMQDLELLQQQIPVFQEEYLRARAAFQAAAKQLKDAHHISCPDTLDDTAQIASAATTLTTPTAPAALLVANTA